MKLYLVIVAFAALLSGGCTVAVTLADRRFHHRCEDVFNLNTVKGKRRRITPPPGRELRARARCAGLFEGPGRKSQRIRT